MGCGVFLSWWEISEWGCERVIIVKGFFRFFVSFFKGLISNYLKIIKFKIVFFFDVEESRGFCFVRRDVD